ncbi:MAG: sigma 54-interacting transcriptional regulator [Polyangiales bacterium]
MSGTVNDSGDNVGRSATRAISYLVLELECDRPTAGSARYALVDGERVSIGRGEARTANRGTARGERFLDLRVPAAAMSTSHARLLPTGSDWTIEDLGSTNGTFVNGARVTHAVLSDGDLVTVGRAIFRYVPSRLTPEGAPLDLDTATFPRTGGRQTLDPALDERLAAVDRIATSAISVLVRGESGTGKERVARAVHDRSGRNGAFVAVNCGAIPAGLVESQLFGHVKGSFSGAQRDEPGTFRAADGGTAFLDEIGDLPLGAQAALLRVLQEREVVPVGGTKPVRVDLRVVAATHQPLETMVSEGKFRRDLLARLAGFTIELPPLRDRVFDVGMIASSLLASIAGERGAAVRLSPAAGEALLRYSWPLNVRELEQALARAVVLAGEAMIDLEHLPTEVTTTRSPPEATRTPGLSERDERVRGELLQQLAEHHGNLADVARVMGKARMQIHRWCQRFGIDPNHYRR